MAGEEGSQQSPGALTEAQAGRMLAHMNDVIRAGEDMRKLRTEMIKLFAGLGWTQEKIAGLTGMSQPAVSKQMAKHGSDDPLPPMGLALDQHDIPWLEGRLWGLAEEISEAFYDTARCTRCVDALARGKKRFTPQNVDELRRLVEEDLRAHPDRTDAGYQAAYDEISRGLDVPAKTPPATAPASVRRTLAHQLQRDRLRGES
ncbi:sigma-70 family RNA polymerase sigma factor [Streptomyces beijiangensis]|uniref:Sigma-70 family RNA polymerase sigma factor n=1 Tax=Streptomyces beijiangensis TaxID=163361 RepID=A0A939JMH6_9ACTN|nr:sigma-70 family RNA polymerase sigma factor [Streptomyces beijiangensis]MBO0517460.1 sigma-70 family RNA polymerase sigma factor [Streptomyces beijiangensis]